MTIAAPALDARSRQLRRLVVRMLKAARRGHVGSAFSCIDILRVLYDDILRFDPRNPTLAGPGPLHPQQGPWLSGALCRPRGQGVLPEDGTRPRSAPRMASSAATRTPTRCPASKPAPARWVMG